MAKSNYWKDRQTDQAKRRVKFTDKQHRKVRKKTARLYKEVRDSVENEMLRLWHEILDPDGVPSANELYRFNRLYKTFEQINKELDRLHSDFFKTIDPEFQKLYENMVKDTMYAIEQDYFDKERAETVANNLWMTSRNKWSKNVWCSDGANAEIRHEKQMYKLSQTLERGMIDVVARGQSKEKLVEDILDRFDVSFSEADRLCRTEMTYLQNQATMDSYIEEGVEKYQFLATVDYRTSEHCLEENGKVYAITDARVGDNYPPCHPNCRCTTIPYLNRAVNRQVSENADRARTFEERAIRERSKVIADKFAKEQKEIERKYREKELELTPEQRVANRQKWRQKPHKKK